MEQCSFPFHRAERPENSSATQRSGNDGSGRHHDHYHNRISGSLGGSVDLLRSNAKGKSYDMTISM